MVTFPIYLNISSLTMQVHDHLFCLTNKSYTSRQIIFRRKYIKEKKTTHTMDFVIDKQWVMILAQDDKLFQPINVINN